MLLNWFKQRVEHNRLETVDYDVLEQVYQDKMEAKQMLETAIAKERERIFAQGKIEGKAEGKAEGKTEGKAEGEVIGTANVLISLLEKRFNPLTPTQKQYLYELDMTHLLKLADKLWQAQSLQDIFNEDEGTKSK